MDQPRTTHLNNLEILLEHLDSLPGEIAALREQQLPLPQYRAEVERILTVLRTQVDHYLESRPVAVRTEQE